VEAQASHVAGAVQDAGNSGLGGGYAEVDVIPAVYGKAEAGIDFVSRDSAVAQPGYAFQVAAEVRKVTFGGRDTADRLQACIDRSKVTSRSTREDQRLRRNRASPLQL